MSETACSFCGKGDNEIRQLLAGPPPLFICNECLDLCNDILGAQEDEESLLSQTPPAWEPSLYLRPMHPPLQGDARGARADVGIGRDSPQPLDQARRIPVRGFATAGRATGQTGAVQGSGRRLRLCHAPGGYAGRRRRNAHPAGAVDRLRKIPGVGCAIGRPQRGPARAGRPRADSRSPALSLWASRGAPSPRLPPSSSDRRAARPRARPGSR
jgi:hypothetical protein